MNRAIMENSRKSARLIIAGAILLFLDQLSKYFVRQNLPLNTQIPVLGKLAYLNFVHNTGAVFGSFKGTNELLIWISVMAIGLVIYLWDQFPKAKYSNLALTFIIVGSLGNLIDRAILGYVTDFLDLRFWPIFNLADSLVTIGILYIAVALITEGDDKKGSGKKESALSSKTGKPKSQ